MSSVSAEPLRADAEPLTLEQYFTTVYEPQHDLRKLTVYSYLASIRSLERWHGAPVTLEMLTDEFISRWLTALLEANIARPTIKSYRGNVLTVWRFAFNRDDLPAPPRIVKRVKLAKRIPSAWTLEQLGAILASAQKEPGDVGRQSAANFWTALVLVLYDTGARITAVMHAQTTDVNLQAATIILRADHQKTRRDECYTLSPQTVAALKKIWSHSRERVFGDWPYGWTQLDWKALTKRYRRILHRAKLPAGPRDMFHKVRRTTATQLAKTLGNNVEASALLGHDSAALTERAYIDSSQIMRRSPADVLPRPSAESAGDA